MTQIQQNDPIQELLITARRNQILDAATKVFADKGFHNATIKDVAKSAGIADGTIYNYFKNKNDLMLGLLDRLNETPQREEQFQESLHTDIKEGLTYNIRHRFEKIAPKESPLFEALIPELMINKELAALYTEHIIAPTYLIATPHFQRLVESGAINSAISEQDLALALRVISGMVLGILVLRSIGDSELESHWDAVPEVIAEILMNGLFRKRETPND